MEKAAHHLRWVTTAVGILSLIICLRMYFLSAYREILHWYIIFVVSEAVNTGTRLAVYLKMRQKKDLVPTLVHGAFLISFVFGALEVSALVQAMEAIPLH